MICGAQRTVAVENLDIGDVIKTEKGMLEVTAVMRSRDETKVFGEPVGGKAKKSQLTYPVGSVVVVPAPLAVVDEIESDVVGTLLGQDRVLWYEREDDSLIVTVNGHRWTLKMRQ